jgi:hypothetical protein
LPKTHFLRLSQKSTLFGPTLALPGGRPKREFWGEPVGWNAILERIAGGKQVSSLSQLFDFQYTTTLFNHTII